MSFDLLVFMICQWGLFAGLVLFLLSWAEKKKQMGRIGLIILSVLGLFAVVVNLCGLIHVPADRGQLFRIDLWGVTLTGISAAVGLVLELKNIKGAFATQLFAVVLALLLFFQIKKVGSNDDHSIIPVSNPMEQVIHHQPGR
jgi:uncharacterized membrane protein